MNIVVPVKLVPDLVEDLEIDDSGHGTRHELVAAHPQRGR